MPLSNKEMMRLQGTYIEGPGDVTEATQGNLFDTSKYQDITSEPARKKKKRFLLRRPRRVVNYAASTSKKYD